MRISISTLLLRERDCHRLITMHGELVLFYYAQCRGVTFTIQNFLKILQTFNFKIKINNKLNKKIIVASFANLSMYLTKYNKLL